MHTLCKPGRLLLKLFVALLIGTIISACGGGGDSDEPWSPNPNMPETTSWSRFDVLKLEGDQPLYPIIQTQMDSQGRVHIFYYRRGETYDGNQVRYQIHHVVWDSQTDALIGEAEMLDVRPPNLSGGDSGLNNCLLLEVGLTTDDLPIVGYQGGRVPQSPDELVCNETAQGDLMLNSFNGTAWDEYLGIRGDASSKNPLFTDGYVGISGTIVIDSQNTVHMAAQHYFEFCDWTSTNYPDLMYIRQPLDNLGQYSTALEELVDDSNIFGSGGGVQSNMGNQCKIVLDADENPVLFYVGTPYQDGQGEDRTTLRMSRRIGGQWQEPEIIEVLDEWSVAFISPALAPDGTLGVAYYMEEIVDSDYPNHLRYAVRLPDGQWDKHIVDMSSHCGDFCSLTYDANGLPVIAYYDLHANSGSYRTREDLKFARFSDRRWEVEAVSTAGDIGQYNSIWVDTNNAVNISTYEFNDQQIVIFREQSE